MMLSHAALLCALATVASAVPVVQLANGVEMPIVSFGTWQYNDSVAEFACTEALSEGFNHFDTALNYNNQAGVGKFLGKALSGTTTRDKIFVTTKVPGCGTFPSVKSGKCGPGTQDAFDQDIKLLSSAMSGGEQLFPDLVLVHSPPLGGCTALTCKEIQAQWRVLETMLAQNKTRAIGVSNYCEACFTCLLKTATVVPMVNQMNYHVGMYGTDSGLKSFLVGKNITLQAWSPLGDGKGTPSLISGNMTNSIGSKHNKTGAQVALKWIVQQGIPLSTKATDPTYIAQDIDLFDWELSAEEMQTLSAATKPSGVGPNVACLM